MNALSTLLTVTAIALSANAFAGDTLSHESLYEPAYLSQLTAPGSAGGGGERSASTVAPHESLYDPVYLRSIEKTGAQAAPAGMVISHESLFETNYLRALGGSKGLRG